MNIVERILQFRAENGLSQQEFADRCGLSKATISHLELDTECVGAGARLSPMTRRRIEYTLKGGIVRKERRK